MCVNEGSMEGSQPGSEGGSWGHFVYCEATEKSVSGKPRGNKY